MAKVVDMAEVQSAENDLVKDVFSMLAKSGNVTNNTLQVVYRANATTGAADEKELSDMVMVITTVNDST